MNNAKKSIATDKASTPHDALVQIEHAPIGIAALDKNGTVKAANQLFRNFCAQSPLNQPFLNLVARTDRTRAKLFLSSLQKNPQPSLEIRLLRRPLQIIELYAAPAKEKNNPQIIYLIDITEQRALETQSAQAQKMQAVGQLAGGIAHDFNNILTAITGACDLAEDQKKAPPEIPEIRRSAQRGAALIRQLLAFSRRQTLRPKTLNLARTAQNIHDLLSRLAGSKISLSFQTPKNLWSVRADQSQIEQVFLNLVVNAADAMPSGGKIDILFQNISQKQAAKLDHVLMPNDNYVLCQVADSGPGIPQHVIGKIFEPFFSTKKHGTGLGLSTVYGIVKQTGGFIFPQTQSKGAVFQIFLPKHSSPQTPTQSAKAAPPSKNKNAADTVLLIEDDPAVRAFVERALSSRGYLVLQADNAQKALSLARKNQNSISIILSDVIMPDMDGYKLAQMILQICPNAKTLFISGYAEDAFRKKIRQSKDIQFLPKPFSLGQLAAAVRETISRKSSKKHS